MVKCKKLGGSGRDLIDIDIRPLRRGTGKNNKKFKILGVQAEVRIPYLRNTLKRFIA